MLAPVGLAASSVPLLIHPISSRIQRSPNGTPQSSGPEMSLLHMFGGKSKVETLYNTGCQHQLSQCREELRIMRRVLIVAAITGTAIGTVAIRLLARSYKGPSRNGHPKDRPELDRFEDFGSE